MIFLLKVRLNFHNVFLFRLKLRVIPVKFPIITIQFLIKLSSVHLAYLVVCSPKISLTFSHSGPLETDSSSALFACVLTEVVARGIGPTFPPRHWKRHPSFAT